MKTQAYFENIQIEISRQLSLARHSVIIAVAWFTDSELFNLLLEQSSRGVNVQLLIVNDEINNQSGIKYEELLTSGGKLWKVNNQVNLMHNKFCVIDEQVVINGSYNWTNKAKYNHESITVIEDTDIALQFLAEFNGLTRKYFGTDSNHSMLDYTKICIRLEIIKELIRLEDIEDFNVQIKKLRMQVPESDINENISQINEILDYCFCKNYSAAVHYIEKFTQRFKTLTVFVDAEIMAMRLELKVLELQVSSLEDERIEIDKLLYTYNIRHDQELGDLVSKLLYLRKERLKSNALKDDKIKEEAEAAEKEYHEYKESIIENKDESITKLSDEELTEIKTKYRKASKLCHPDVVAEQYKDLAHDVFQVLQKSYEINDLSKVSEILTNLEKGIFFTKSEIISKKEEIKRQLMQLRFKRDELEKELNLMKKSEIFNTIRKIENWDDYFSDLKRKLETEIIEMTQLK